MHTLPSLETSRRDARRIAGAARRFAVAAFAAAVIAGLAAAPAAAETAAADTAAVETAAADTAAAETAVTWDVATTDGPQGTGRANYHYSVSPGERIEDSVRISNPGDAPIELELYAADAFTTEAGQLDIRTKSHPAAGVGAWLTAATAGLALQPGEYADVPFTIAVPDDAAGEYVGAIVTSVQEASGEAAERRAAIRVRLHVGASFAPSLAVDDVRVDYSGAALGDGAAKVSYTIRNTGDTVLSAGQSVLIAGPFDLAQVEAADIEQTPALLPGESWNVVVPFDGVAPLGTLTASVRAVPLYTDPAGSTGALEPVDVTAVGWAIPWVPVLIVVVLIGAIVFVLVRRSARSRGADARTVEQPEGEPARG